MNLLAKTKKTGANLAAAALIGVTFSVALLPQTAAAQDVKTMDQLQESLKESGVGLLHSIFVKPIEEKVKTIGHGHTEQGTTERVEHTARESAERRDILNQYGHGGGFTTTDIKVHTDSDGNSYVSSDQRYNDDVARQIHEQTMRDNAYATSDYNRRIIYEQGNIDIQKMRDKAEADRQRDSLLAENARLKAQLQQHQTMQYSQGTATELGNTTTRFTQPQQKTTPQLSPQEQKKLEFAMAFQEDFYETPKSERQFDAIPIPMQNVLKKHGKLRKPTR